MLVPILAVAGAVGFYFWNRERLADDDWERLNSVNPAAAVAINSIVNGTVTNRALIATTIQQLENTGYPHLADKVARSAT